MGERPQAKTKWSRIGNFVTLASLLLGVALLVVLCARLDVHEVMARLRQVGWYFVAGLGCFALNQLASTAAWRAMIPPAEPDVRFRDLFAAFMAGGALNALTPGNSAGEFLKGTLLRGKVRGEALVGSLINYNFLMTASMMLSNVVGAGLCLGLLHLPTKVLLLIFGLALLFLIPLLAVALVLRLGAARTVVRLLGKLPLLRFKDPAAVMARAEGIDTSVRTLWREHPRRFRRVVLFLVCARVVYTAELWCFLLGLLPGRGAAWLALLAMLMETANQLLAWALSVVPGQVGVAEGNASVVFGALGLEPVVGFSLLLLRRIRMLLAIALGLTLGWFLGLRPSGARRMAQRD